MTTRAPEPVVTPNPAVAVPERTYRAVVRDPEPIPLEDEIDAERAREHAARFERLPENGVYQGPLPIRELPRGYGGERLREEKERRLVVGALWLRGNQRVRVTRATPNTVTFEELSHGKATRRLNRTAFLSSGNPA